MAYSYPRIVQDNPDYISKCGCGNRPKLDRDDGRFRSNFPAYRVVCDCGMATEYVNIFFTNDEETCMMNAIHIWNNGMK